ncbi:MAG: hypothetical protein AAF493_29020, partial [Pseudomonadota bacterium]
ANRVHAVTSVPMGVSQQPLDQSAACASIVTSLIYLRYSFNFVGILQHCLSGQVGPLRRSTPECGLPEI